MGDADRGWSPTTSVLIGLSAIVVSLVVVFALGEALDYPLWLGGVLGLMGMALTFVSWRCTRKRTP